MATNLNPYLSFDGQAREAMSFYQQCFGGELQMQKISESPMAAQMPSEMGAHIMHSCLTSGSLVLMGSDLMRGKPIRGNDFTLCLNFTTDEELSNAFNKLAEGGEVIMGLHQTFWGATYGELKDKYGFNWALNYSKN